MVKQLQENGVCEIPPPIKTGNENIIQSYYLQQGSRSQPEGQHNPKSSQIFIYILSSNFKVISPDVLVLSHIGCPSKVSYKKKNYMEKIFLNKVSYKKTTKVKPWKHSFLLQEALIVAGAVLPPCGATSEKVELPLKNNRTHTHHQSKRISF